MNSFGQIYRLTTFGESHGPAIGGIVDGMPAGVTIDFERIQKQIDRRRPGQSKITTQRRESDKVEFLSGIFEGKTIGSPIGFIIRNSDQHSSDYDNLKNIYRPSHADFAYHEKYGHRDHRGGGRSSARETASRVVGGSLAMEVLRTQGIRIYAYTSRVGNISLPEDFPVIIENPEIIDSNIVRCPHPFTAEKMENLIEEVKKQGDTIGGNVTCVIEGVPSGLGEPVFDKLQAMLAHAMLSINAAKGFEYGMGFKGCLKKGSEQIDLFVKKGEKIGTVSNNSGGIQGGISIGEPIYFNIAFKPVATLLQTISGMDSNGNEVKLEVKGRHDPCVLPRAVPVVESMAAMTILDALLLRNASCSTL